MRDLFDGDYQPFDGERPRIVIYGPRDQKRLQKAKKRGVQIINTTSHSDDWGRQLSPFLLGPVALYGGHIAQNVENAWQYSKLYQTHADADGTPTEEYWEWARDGWAKRRAVRYPMGKGARPLCSLWDGEHLDYVEARHRIYVPLYSRCVRRTPAWKKLLKMAAAGEEIHLWDFDGYDYQAEGLSIDDALDDPKRKFGHSMVLALMLEQEHAR